VHHPLQPFAQEYFLSAGGAQGSCDPRLRSFDEDYCEALRRRLEGQQNASATRQASERDPAACPGSGMQDLEEVADEADGDEVDSEEAADCLPGRFFSAPLPAPDPGFEALQIETLVQFLRNPCRYLLRARLGIELARPDEDLPDEEVFLADRSAIWSLGARILPRLLAGESVADVRTAARAGNEYPIGPLGDIQAEQELLQLGDFAQRVAADLCHSPRSVFSHTLCFSLDGCAWQLAGNLRDLGPTGLIRYRYDDMRAGDYLEAWVAHLFLNAAQLPLDQRHTVWHARDGRVAFPPVEQAHLRLQELLELYREGLNRPVHFFPKAALAFQQGGGSLADARRAWRPAQPHARGESSDPSYRLALRGLDDPLDEDFMRCARTVFEPLLKHLHHARVQEPA